MWFHLILVSFAAVACVVGDYTCCISTNCWGQITVGVSYKLQWANYSGRKGVSPSTMSKAVIGLLIFEYLLLLNECH